MSPRPSAAPPSAAASHATDRIAAELGAAVLGERTRRGWTLRQLADRAGLSATAVQRVETGRPAALETYARIATALGLRPEFTLVDPRHRDRRDRPLREEDPVHAAMGEVEARHLRGLGFDLSLDEPFQHYQFAGRGDLVAWSVERRALLHLENRHS